MHSQQFPYPHHPDRPDELGMPYIPISFISRQGSFQHQALLDSGSRINVLPYSAGLALGAIWGTTPEVILSGNLGKLPAYAIGVPTQIGDFAPRPLLFAWSQSEEPPVILGLLDFFLEFNVCFFASEGTIEIAPREVN